MRVEVKDVMTMQVASVNGSTPFKDATEALIAHSVSTLPVVDGDGLLEGIVSHHDLLKVFVRRDADIADEVCEEILQHTLWEQPNDATAPEDRHTDRAHAPAQ
ncbi:MULTISPECIES: CBS domain-containing protein [Streptosporangium]|uniref:CBS-domain-containing membrane protein n=1 Tax=Streptosporangium brasiliense TaxID=47480 RepID=A0ABT9RG78_9ACTN|nr:CBS domain-containing protein [Streptosporangium brasiliense]MDP9868259.1 CBS-domain-containing membrane protein [Streptosporangium brasiliense]